MDATRYGMYPPHRAPLRRVGQALVLICLAVVLAAGLGAPLAKAQTRTLQLDFADGLVTARLAAAPLKDVARILEEKTGLSVVLDDRVATAEVTVSFDRLPLKQAVETIMEPFSTVVTYNKNRTMRGVFVMEGGTSGPQAAPQPGFAGGSPVTPPPPAPQYVPPPPPPVSPSVPEPQPAPEPQVPAQGQDLQTPAPGQEPQAPPPAALGGPIPEGQAGPTLPLPPAVPPQETGQPAGQPTGQPTGQP